MIFLQNWKKKKKKNLASLGKCFSMDIQKINCLFFNFLQLNGAATSGGARIFLQRVKLSPSIVSCRRISFLDDNNERKEKPINPFYK